MKKLFFASILMLLTSISAGPGSLAKAEESNKETIPGYITNNLIDINNTVDETYDNQGTSKGTLIDDNFYQTEATAFEVTEVSTALLDVLNDNANESFGTAMTWNAGLRTLSYMQNTYYSYYVDDILRSTAYPDKQHDKTPRTFATFKLQCNYFINDWSDEEQPLEFIIDNNYTMLAFFCKLYIDENVEIPLIRINGQTICNLNYDAENKSSSISGVNARVYPGIYDGELTGKLFCEIPFMEFIETIEITGAYDITASVNDDNTLRTFLDSPNEYPDPNTQYYLKDYLYGFYNSDDTARLLLSHDIRDNSSFSPILIEKLDFENNSLKTVSPVGKSNRYIVDSIYLEDDENNEVEVKTTIIPDAPLDLINKDTDAWRRALTDKFQTYELSLDDKPFNYNSDNDFIKRVKNSGEDFEFNVTAIKYHISTGDNIPSTAVDINDLKNSLDPSTLLDDETTKTIVQRPKKIKVSAKDIDYHGGGNGSWTITREDGTTKTYHEGDELEEQDIDIKSIIVDYGNYYAFKVIKKEQIHIASFPAYASQSIFGSSLRFDVIDNSVNQRISSLNAIYVSYKFNNSSYGISFMSENAVHQFFGGSKILNIIVACPVLDIVKWCDGITKTDTNGNSFTFRAQTIPDRIAGLFSGVTKDFIIATNGNVEFSSIYSAVYYDKAGAVIQAVSRFNDNNGGTAVIGEDGTVTILDNNGKVLDDYYIDENGVMRDPEGKERAGDKPSDGYDLSALMEDLFKGVSTLITKGFGIIIAVLIIYLIIKLLPDIVEFFKKLGKK